MPKNTKIRNECAGLLKKKVLKEADDYQILIEPVHNRQTREINLGAESGEMD